jgi:hypothetical protein
LNNVQPEKPRYKCLSDPTSPSRFNPSQSAVDELLHGLDTDSDSDEEIPFSTTVEVEPKNNTERETVSFKRFDRLNHFVLENKEQTELESPKVQKKQLLKTLSRSERIGLVWPEQPLDLLSNRTATLTSTKTFKSVKSFRNYGSFKVVDDGLATLKENLMADVGLDRIELKRRSSSFVRIMSKQMVGVFISIWVRRTLRKHIQNLKVSTVGVGAMGYIGNKVRLFLHIISLLQTYLEFETVGYTFKCKFYEQKLKQCGTGVNICKHVNLSDIVLFCVHAPLVWRERSGCYTSKCRCARDTPKDTLQPNS